MTGHTASHPLSYIAKSIMVLTFSASFWQRYDQRSGYYEIYIAKDRAALYLLP